MRQFMKTMLLLVAYLLLPKEVQPVTLEMQDAGMSEVYSLEWSPDGNFIVGIDMQGFLHLWNGFDGSLVKEFKVYDEGVSEFAWSPDSSRIAVATPKDFTVRIWDITTTNLLHTLQLFPSSDEGVSVEWQPNGSLLAAVAFGESESVVIWQETSTGFQEIPTGIKASLAYDLRWSPDGSKLVIADFAGLHVIDSFSNPPFQRRTIVSDTSLWVSWSPDSTKLATLSATDYISGKNEIRVVSVETEEVLETLPSSESFIGDLTWSLDGTSVTTQTGENQFNVWSLSSNSVVETFSLSDGVQYFRASRSPYGGRVPLLDTSNTNSRNSKDLSFITFNSSLKELESVSASCLTQATSPSQEAQALLSKQELDTLDKGKLPNFVDKVKQLKKGDIPEACAADLIAVAEAVIAEG